MTNPEKDTPEYQAKLKQTRLGKQRRSDNKFAKSPKGLRLIRATQLRILAKTKNVQDNMQEEINKHSSRANSYYRDLARVRKQVDRIPVLESKSKRLAKKVEELEEALEAAGDKRKALEKELRTWTMFWGWVRVHSRPGTLMWLRRLWEKGPKAAPDKCWGGGQ